MIWTHTEMRCGLRENVIERALVAEVKRRGGMALKFVSPGTVGVPDRLILLPGAKIAFAEIKSPGEKMRPVQIKRKRQLEALGFLVYCIDGTEQIGEVLDELVEE